MKLNKLLSICLGITLAFSVSANDLSEARIYINPGHGGWGPNDRPMATINYAQMDTLGFFETNTNLIKGMALREELVKARAGYVRMSRTVNGVVSADDEHKTENDKYIETQPGAPVHVGCRIDRNAKLLAQIPDRLDMIRMIVGNQHGHDLGKIDRPVFNTFFMVRIPIPASISIPNSEVPK